MTHEHEMNDGATTQSGSPDRPSHSYRGGRGKAFFKILHRVAILKAQGVMNEDEVNDTQMTWINELYADGMCGLHSCGPRGGSCGPRTAKTLG